MLSLYRLFSCLMILVLCPAFASAGQRRSLLSHHPRGQQARPPPRQLIGDWGTDNAKREAPDIHASSSFSVSASFSSVTSSATSSSGMPAPFSHEVQFVDTSTSSGPSTSSTPSSAAESYSQSTSTSTSAPVSSFSSESFASASASASGATNDTSFLDPEGWHFPYMALWNGTQPDVADVRQVRMANCWMVASTIAVVHHYPEWISHLFSYPDGTPMVGQSYPTSREAKVQLWNPRDGWTYDFPVNIYNESTTEDFPGGAWWHSALSQAFQGMAQIADVDGMNSDGTYTQTSGAPIFPLAMMTGRFVTYYTVGAGSDLGTVDAFYTACANATFTPVVVATRFSVGSTDPPITPNHDYAVVGVDDRGNAGRFINVRDPWGEDRTFKAKDLFDNCFWFYVMEDQSPLVWQD